MGKKAIPLKMISSYGGNDITAVVFDLGSKYSKVGFAGEFEPRGVFPSCPNLQSKSELSWPISQGLVEDIDQYTALVKQSFEYLSADSKEHPVMLVDVPWNTSEGRQKLCELYFETFNVPGFYLGRSAVLSAFAAGRASALVLDSGASTTSIVPVVDGYVTKKAIERSELAGDYLDAQIEQWLKSQVLLPLLT